jgi:predicted  nucleic acid-binding Zn-ribbon protein
MWERIINHFRKQRCAACRRRFTAGAINEVANNQDTSIVKLICTHCGHDNGKALVGFKDAVAV